MKKTFGALVVVAAASLASPALAGPFFGANAGYSTSNVDCSGTSSCDDDDFGYKVYGGYMFGPHWGLEALYINVGKVRASVPAVVDSTPVQVDADIKTDGYGAGILLNLSTNPSWDFLLRLGVLSANSKATVSAAGFGSASDSNRVATVYYGIGGGYRFTKNVAVVIEADGFNAKDIADQSYGSWLISAGVRVQF